MTFFRLLIGIPLAALVTLGLFLLMRALVTSDEDLVREEIDRIAINLTRVDREEATDDSRRELQRPERQEPPPPPPPAAPRDTARPNIGAVPIGPAGGLAFNLNLSAPTDRNVQPIVRAPAQYPPRALERGLEGWVTVEVSVDEQGNVIDARVVAAQPSGVFDRAALNAIRRFRYRPRIVDGNPVPQHGIHYTFQFQIQDDTGRGGRR
jgi:protein TonB